MLSVAIRVVARLSAARLAAIVLAAMLAAVPAAAVRAAEADSPNIACASDLKFAIDEIAAKFAAETGLTVRPTYGSSGNFYRQIAEGAPFELFMSADVEFISKLAGAGMTESPGELYAVGRLVLFAPNGSPLDATMGIEGLKAGLAQGLVKRFAIANPEHAPYGRAAEQALRAAGLWEAIQPKLVLGENVSQAAQFATSGSAEGGIFAYSLALSPAVSGAGHFVLLPQTLHAPLNQGMALIKGAGATARAFYDFVRQPAARAIFRKYGFLLPGESS
jgi:molybdate transport system substrate-binding protein